MVKKLPIGIQNFPEIIEDDYVYIDKTKDIYNLISSNKYYFLARPRRFGKSLLLSTLESIFLGEKKLFKDLWIEQSDYNWEEFFVLKIDFSEIPSQSPEHLENSLKEFLNHTAKKYQIKLEDNYLEIMFKRLVEAIHEQGKKLVVLIDEYDKPIISNLAKPEIAEANRNLLKGFYEVLKSQSHRLRFVILTGVSKFAKVSVFSGLNNLIDISLNENYASLLGYTAEELEKYFSKEFKNLADKSGKSLADLMKQTQEWYNGYQFSHKDIQVYNPFSTLLLLENQIFKNYWFETATPTLLIKQIQKQKTNLKDFEKAILVHSDFDNYEIENIPILTLMYNTGYLTIKKAYENNSIMNYEISYPNEEVRISFLKYLLKDIYKVESSNFNSLYQSLLNNLNAKLFNEFFECVKTLIANLSYDIQIPQERYYQSIITVIFGLLGFKLVTEEHSNTGRIDLAACKNNTVYIFEFKLDKPAQEALTQIKDKKYYEKYLAADKPEIYLAGISFSSTDRNIKEFLVEKL